ncbi:hypothetical protein [Tsukamurella sp. PLM1]|uniref:hypothetical protein n=1 Tax=Tsukamurella sp. PLM1 TaxID=2929795 RepID=UPI00206068CE|nr:hypothetical protein [Tsukamurella sp. PLM1]BDH57554.1 hypothetical protein MTP03_24930 [Tsukamurella sp. PLM1]
MRAVELDRDVVVSATTGVSALVRPDGAVPRRTAVWTNDHLIETITLRAGLTPAVRLGIGERWRCWWRPCAASRSR